YALQPYYRESRRLQGLVTVCEQDILPAPGGIAAALPVDANNNIESIAVGNYPNDHHYAGDRFLLASKTMGWGGRTVGTPFSIPYRALVPQDVDGLLVAEKNISVSHIANGATRLQPVVLGIGQAAGMAAALCCRHHCQPRDLPVRSLQEALLTDKTAPAAVIPLLNRIPQDPQWLQQQRDVLAYPERYRPMAGLSGPEIGGSQLRSPQALSIAGQLRKCKVSEYGLVTYSLVTNADSKPVTLITLVPWINAQLQQLPDGAAVTVAGQHNESGGWFVVADLRQQ
ncbi:MAG: FAD-dependent oxidoreductase, partial [Elainellaceae cyanobacterium]